MMIRHHSYFEALGDFESRTPDWTAVFAGLSVLRILDRLAADNDVRGPAEWPEMHNSRNAVDAVNPGDPARAILLRILDRVQSDARLGAEIGADLILYGRALGLDARWSLAADVFQSIGDNWPSRHDARLAIEASTLLGAAARNLGDWSASDRAYTRAEYLAESIGDRSLALTVQVGFANSEMIRGNLSGAEETLEPVLAEAESLNLEPVRAIALHTKASLAHLSGDYQGAIHFAYRSLELTSSSSARERLLSDIAAAYTGLGMRDAARDAHSIVALTSPHQWVRWQATLNLMELSIDDGDEAAFDNYMKQVESASLDPRLRAYFLFFRAKGYRRFGREGVEQLFEEARTFAESHRLNQISFEIEAAKEKQAADASTVPSGELAEIAEVLEHLREEASI